jgi:hypothetical protein
MTLIFKKNNLGIYLNFRGLEFGSFWEVMVPFKTDKIMLVNNLKVINLKNKLIFGF